MKPNICTHSEDMSFELIEVSRPVSSEYEVYRCECGALINIAGDVLPVFEDEPDKPMTAEEIDSFIKAAISHEIDKAIALLNQLVAEL